MELKIKINFVFMNYAELHQAINHNMGSFN